MHEITIEGSLFMESKASFQALCSNFCNVSYFRIYGRYEQVTVILREFQIDLYLYHLQIRLTAIADMYLFL